MGESTKLQFRLSARERELIARYGYPFDDLNEQLNRLAGVSAEAAVTIDPFYVECLTADLIRSARALTDETVLEEIDALLTVLETRSAARHSGLTAYCE